MVSSDEKAPTAAATTPRTKKNADTASTSVSSSSDERKDNSESNTAAATTTSQTEEADVPSSNVSGSDAVPVETVVSDEEEVQQAHPANPLNRTTAVASRRTALPNEQPSTSSPPSSSSPPALAAGNSTSTEGSNTVPSSNLTGSSRNTTTATTTASGQTPVRLAARREGDRLVFSFQQTQQPNNNNNNANHRNNIQATSGGPTTVTSIRMARDGQNQQRTWRIGSSSSRISASNNNNNDSSSSSAEGNSNNRTSSTSAAVGSIDNNRRTYSVANVPSNSSATTSERQPSQGRPQNSLLSNIVRDVARLEMARSPRVYDAPPATNGNNPFSFPDPGSIPVNGSSASSINEALGIRRIQALPDGRVQLDMINPNQDPIVLERDTSTQIGNQRITASTHGNNGVSLRVVQMNPLEPRLLPEQDIATSLPHEEDERYHKFKCTICLEFMENPVGCGNSRCGSRFCQKCLMRVVSGKDNRSRSPLNATDSNNNKCPTCRTFFTEADITPNVPLLNEMRQLPPVPCKYQACTAQLRLNEIASHEHTCEQAQVTCRYEKYGCSWKGKKRDVAHHEQHHCALARVSVLVDQLRELRGDVSSRMGMLQQQANSTMHLHSIHSQNLQRLQHVSTSDPWSILKFTLLVIASTPYMIHIKDHQWTNYWRNTESQVCIHNALLLLPTILSSVAMGYKAFALLWEYLGSTPEESSDLVVIEEILLYSCVFWIAALMGIANLVDDKSSTKWQKFRLPVVGKQAIMKDALAISSFAIHLVLADSQNSTIKANVVWLLVLFLTVILPSAMLRIAQSISSTANRNALDAPVGRARGPVLFGLRYALVAQIFDIPPMLDAAIVMTTLRPYLDQHGASEFVADECFLEFLPAQLGAAYMGIRLAVLGYIWHTEQQDAATIGTWAAESVVAFMCLLVLNLLCHSLVKAGFKWGDQIYSQAKRYVRPDGGRRDGTSRDYTLSGMILLGSWSMSLLLLWKAAST